MASMVPREDARGFLKWLNGQSIVGSASEPQRFAHWAPAHVAILFAARYVNASCDARAWGEPRDDTFGRDAPPRAASARPASARPAFGGGRRIAVRDPGRLHRRTVSE